MPRFWPAVARLRSPAAFAAAAAAVRGLLFAAAGLPAGAATARDTSTFFNLTLVPPTSTSTWFRLDLVTDPSTPYHTPRRRDVDGESAAPGTPDVAHAILGEDEDLMPEQKHKDPSSLHAGC